MISKHQHVYKGHFFHDLSDRSDALYQKMGFEFTTLKGKERLVSELKSF